MLALSPLVNGCANSKTLPLLESTTQRLPCESNVKAYGESRLDWVGGVVPFLEAKLLKPITVDALCPFANAYARGVATTDELRKIMNIAKPDVNVKRFLFPNLV